MGVGKAVARPGLVGGKRALEGARRPLLGVLGVLVGEARPEGPFRVFATGRAGRAEVGGPPVEGRDGFGRPPGAAIVLFYFKRTRRCVFRLSIISPCRRNAEQESKKGDWW